MAVVFNKKNNVKLKIEAPMTSVSNLLIVDKGELLGDDFTVTDTDKYIKGTLFKFDGENVSQIEISKVITKSGNFLTLERAVEPCPMNYSSSQMYQQAYDFEAGDWFYINLTAGDLEDIVTELKATNRRIDNVENNYVSKQQLNQEKGTTIATLGNDGKIPSNQIDTNNLDVSSINYEFTAGESISAGDLVSTYYTLGTTENSATLGTDLYFSFSSTSDYNNRYQTILTHTLTANQNYITKVTLDYVRTESNTNYAASGVVMIRNRGRLLGQANYGKENGAITININSIVVGDIEVYIFCSAVYNYSKYGRFNNVKLFSKVVNSPGRICKASSSTYKLSSYIGIATNSGTSGSKIRVKNYGVVNYNGVKSGVTYGQRKGQLIYGTGVGVGIATNVLFLYNKINIDIINLYFAVSQSTTYQVTIQHNLGTVPLGIYDVNFNLIETIIEKTSQDFTIQLDQNSPQTGYNFKFYVIG